MATAFTKVVGKAYWRRKALEVQARLPPLWYRLINWCKESFMCPVCDYSGPFKDQLTPDTIMGHSVCPKCGSMERHRLQYLVMKTLRDQVDFSRMSMLHFAPEPFFRELFKKWFRSYTTADIARADVDCLVDLRDLPFEDNSFDCIYASHVLGHIREDDRALSEIERVLAPAGIAVLPVPIVSVTTIEYPEAYEFGYARATGADYFEKYEKYFANVKTFSSNDFPSKYQVFIYEDKTVWPTPERPLAYPMEGKKHVDIVPVSYVSSSKVAGTYTTTVRIAIVMWIELLEFPCLLSAV
jgi:SAM-dependent methyltransferase